MTAVVAFPAANVGADNDAIAHAQRDSLKVSVFAVSSDGRNRTDVLVPLDDRKFQFAAAVLRGVALKGVLVRSANTGQFHLHQNATGCRFRQRIFPDFVSPWLNQRRREHALGRHN